MATKLNIDHWSPDQGLPSFKFLNSNRHDADDDDRAGLYRIAAMVREIKRADGVDVSDCSCPYIEAYFMGGVASGRLDADGDPDPDDLKHRSATGRNAAVRDPGSMPDVAGMDLRQAKMVAMNIGAYDLHLRLGIAESVIARLTELGADKLVELLRALWADDALLAQSDDEAEGEAARSDSTDEDSAAKRLVVANRKAVNKRGKNGRK